MQRVAAGDLDQLKLLFERYHRHIHNYLYKMCGDAQLSEDLTQDVFYRLIKYRDSYGKGSFKAWLFTMARNGLRTHFRRDHSYSLGVEVLEYSAANQGDPLFEERDQLQYALAKLDPAERELIVLSRIREIRHEDLAEMMGSTPGAIKTKLCRVLKKLRVIYFESI